MDAEQTAYQVHLDRLRFDILSRVLEWYPSQKLGRQMTTADAMFKFATQGINVENAATEQTIG